MSPATLWGSWLGSMAESFHPMVMEQFYKESLDLVNRCNTMSRQLQQQDAKPQPTAVVPPAFLSLRAAPAANLRDPGRGTATSTTSTTTVTAAAKTQRRSLRIFFRRHRLGGNANPYNRSSIKHPGTHPLCSEHFRTVRYDIY